MAELERRWHRVPTPDALPEGRVCTVNVGTTTLAKYEMNITHIVLNNGELGKISKEQRAGSWEVWATDLRNPSFAAFAELCGVLGIRVERRDQLEAALSRALSHPGPSLVEIVADPALI